MTLIELLGVAIIVILLSVMAMPVYGEVSDRARMAKSADELRVIEQALEAYKAERGFYPQNLMRLVDHGYLKMYMEQGDRRMPMFASPWSNSRNRIYYFYAVDRSGADTARAYALGDPGSAGHCNEIPSAAVLSANPEIGLPCGKEPDGQAWIFGDPNSLRLEGGPRATLRGYRPDLKTES